MDSKQIINEYNNSVQSLTESIMSKGVDFSWKLNSEKDNNIQLMVSFSLSDEDKQINNNIVSLKEKMQEVDKVMLNAEYEAGVDALGDLLQRDALGDLLQRLAHILIASKLKLNCMEDILNIKKRRNE
jgi:hypothetical protein